MADKDWDRPIIYICDGCGTAAPGTVASSLKTLLMPPGWRRRLVNDNIVRACSEACEKLVDAEVD